MLPAPATICPRRVLRRQFGRDKSADNITLISCGLLYNKSQTSAATCRTRGLMELHRTKISYSLVDGGVEVDGDKMSPGNILSPVWTGHNSDNVSSDGVCSGCRSRGGPRRLLRRTCMPRSRKSREVHCCSHWH